LCALNLFSFDFPLTSKNVKTPWKVGSPSLDRFIGKFCRDHFVIESGELLNLNKMATEALNQYDHQSKRWGHLRKILERNPGPFSSEAFQGNIQNCVTLITY
jgi:hypothetical protein